MSTVDSLSEDSSCRCGVYDRDAGHGLRTKGIGLLTSTKDFLEQTHIKLATRANFRTQARFRTQLGLKRTGATTLAEKRALGPLWD
jgi:hypothetical protein